MNSTISDPSRTICVDVVNCTQCIIRYTGQHCEIDVLDSPYFFTLLLSYQIIFLIMYPILVFYTGYLITKKISYTKSIFKIALFPSYLLELSFIFRIVFMIDPLGIYLVYDPRSLYIVLLTYIPPVFLWAAAALNTSLWMEIMESAITLDDKGLSFKLPKVLTLGIVIFFGIFFTVFQIIAVIFGEELYVIMACNVLFILLALTVLFSVIIYLPRVYSKVKSMNNSNMINLQKGLLYLAITTSTVVPVMIVLIVIKAVLGTNDEEYVFVYFAYQFVLRAQEIIPSIIIILNTLVFIKNGDK